MGYRVKILKTKHRAWKLQYESYKGGIRKAWDIQESEFYNLGISATMPLESIKKRCQQLNSQERLKTLQEAKKLITDRITSNNLVTSCYLPVTLVTSFEEEFIHGKLTSHWACVKKLIVTLDRDYTQWADSNKLIYKLCISNGYSYSYIQKILLLMNRWGKYCARSAKIYYEPIPFPRSSDKEKILDSHQGGSEALPLTPELLLTHKSKLMPESHNWLYISLWFGLRPSEVDQLHEPVGPRSWNLDNNTLWVFQRKLSGIGRDRRLKPIPLKYEEQNIAFCYIQAGAFKRPLTKTLQKHLGEGIRLYSGRKGFTDLMLAKGNRLEAISQWLGHQSIDRTWKIYKDKKRILLD